MRIFVSRQWSMTPWLREVGSEGRMTRGWAKFGSGPACQGCQHKNQAVLVFQLSYTTSHLQKTFFCAAQLQSESPLHPSCLTQVNENCRPNAAHFQALQTVLHNNRASMPMTYSSVMRSLLQLKRYRDSWHDTWVVMVQCSELVHLIYCHFRGTWKNDRRDNYANIWKYFLEPVSKLIGQNMQRYV